MPENGQSAPKPEEPKPESKPVEKPEPEEAQEKPHAKAKRRYVDYNKISTEEAAVMLKRIRKRMTLIINMIDEIMDILKYGAPQQYQGKKYQQNSDNRYRRGYGKRQYGYKRNYRQRRSDEDDVNYE